MAGISTVMARLVPMRIRIGATPEKSTPPPLAGGGWGEGEYVAPASAYPDAYGGASGHDGRRQARGSLLASIVLAAALTLLASVGSAVEKHSGYDDASPDTRAMQDDDASNPAFLWVQQGEALWSEGTTGGGRSCADCHGAAPVTMRGVAARYPRYDAHLGRPITLAQRIEQCRTERQGLPPLPLEGDTLLGLSAFVGLQSRGMPMQVEIDGPARPFFQAGKALFMAREGQLNLSCSQCHDGLAGQRLGGSPIPQGHANGYPEYRLEWQSMGSLERRIRNCVVGVRAEPFAAGSPELTDLELYLRWRSNGLKVETPAVRP
jgi:L-cysteine S-thiosulfotransferase